MVKVGVIGLGMMGVTHLDVYSKREDVEVVAIADIDADRLHGRSQAAGNVEGQAQGGFDRSKVKLYDEGKKLIRDKDVQVVDICLQTQQHLEFAKAALRAGKHVLVEKPVCRTYREAKKLVAAVEKAGTFAMVAQCMRFWPGWDWLKQAVAEQRYGKVLSATFRRVCSHPGGPFYSDGARCGGALLDLHVHDVDFIQYCFGMPKAVRSVGYSKVSMATDHVVTQYHYDQAPIVVAEGGWVMAAGFGFSMHYTVNFERATAVFDLAAKSPLTLYEPGQAAQAVALPAGMGYEHEIAYFVNCVKTGQPPTTVTVQDAAKAVKIVEAELKSIQTGRPVKVSAD